ncbi:MAG: hypothetical protein LBC93_02100 [Synergistaceae bacterium]|jgi:hypothetical protein|nr:hypothetical protein [Synergistaceae bacterium]
MLGWWIIIEDPASAKNDDPKAGRLADWEVGIGGGEWLTDLEKAGKAVLVKSNCGYPNSYKALAGDVLPLLNDGPPSFQGLGFFTDDPPFEVSGGRADGVSGDNGDEEEFYYIPAGWTGRRSFDQEAIAACPFDRELVIEVWDLS